jgi:predicted amidophosphoribosyltransferase
VEAILLLKFEQVAPLGAWSTERVAEVVRREGSAMAADVVVPVPLHRQRERERGYNYAALLSRPPAKRLHLPHKAVPLMRTRGAGQAHPQFGRKLEVRPWRFCHTSRQPS